MSLESDLLIDRGRLKRGLALWRVIAIVAIIGAAALLYAPLLNATGGPHVARLTIAGVITADREREEALAELARDPSARALILVIDSPGGTVSGGESLHRSLSAIAAAKPVVAIMQGTAASAGYMIAMPAQRVFAQDSTVTGSIGVIMQTTDVSALLERLGVRAEALTSGPLKDQPSPFRPLTEEGRAALNAVVRDLYDQFVAMVVKGRGMDEARVRTLADGRIFTGRQAVAAGLVDAIGGEAEARAWLAAERGVPESLQMRDLEEPEERRLLPRLLRDARKALVSERLSLDGMLALWQPSLQ